MDDLDPYVVAAKRMFGTDRPTPDQRRRAKAAVLSGEPYGTSRELVEGDTVEVRKAKFMVGTVWVPARVAVVPDGNRGVIGVRYSDGTQEMVMRGQYR